MHHPDSAIDGGPRGASGGGVAEDLDAARVRAHETCEDVHERGLSGAVLAEERVDLTGLQLEVDPVVRADAGKLLDDPA